MQNKDLSTVCVTKLHNGLTVATDSMLHMQTVALVVQVNTGSNNEIEKKQGISHFLEHMAFKGTKNRSYSQIAQEFDAIGGYFNAYTSREKTVYYIKVLKEDLELGADILSDILQNSLFLEYEVQKEKDVILQEIAQTNDAPDDIIFDVFHETAYPNQSFGRSILGTVERVNSFSRSDIVGYVNENYFNGNIIISAAGKIEHVELLDIVSKKFSSFNSVGAKYEEDAKYIGGVSHIQRDLEQVHFILGFESVPYLHDDFYAYQILSLIAGGGMSSRLFQEIRENLGLAYSVSAYNNSYVSTGMFNMYAATSPESAELCASVMMQELSKLATYISDGELMRAKSQIRAGLMMSYESVAQRAERIASQLLSYNRVIPIDEILSSISSVTTEKLQMVAGSLCKKVNFSTFSSIGSVEAEKILAKSMLL